jgi:SAM-dependent methyltransferase
VIEFLAGDGIELGGKRVADIGCGDGIIDLGLVHRAAPHRLVGFDLQATDEELLLRMAVESGAADSLPENLEFQACGETELPAETGAFDVVVSWSAFEHIEDPISQLREIRRVLADDGILFIQVWPFYDSEHGSHLWGWYPEGFAQFLHSDDEIDAKLRAENFGDPGWSDRMLDIFHTLNRVGVDALHRSLLAAGFHVAKAELITNAVHIPPALAHIPLSVLGIGGVKLLARPR